jgi:hypothetical protein
MIPGGYVLSIMGKKKTKKKRKKAHQSRCCAFSKCPVLCRRKDPLGNMPSRYTRTFLLVL